MTVLSLEDLALAPACSVHVAIRLDLALPLHRYLEAFPDARDPFVLDGVRPEARSACGRGQASLLSVDPFLTIRAYREAPDAASEVRSRVVIEASGRSHEILTGDPLPFVRRLLRAYAVPARDMSPCPLPFLGGAVGYVGYEHHEHIEPASRSPRPAFGMPDLAFGLYDWILGYDAATRSSWLSIIGRGRTEEEARTDAESHSERICATIAAFESSAAKDAETACPRALAPPPHELRVEAHLSREEYLARIASAKEHIVRGDVFEVCLTRAMDLPFTGSPWALFRNLRERSPAPFASYMHLSEGAIVSSSPERFVRLNHERIVESRPIKGTRPRGTTDDDDDRIAEELRHSPKDRAENTMIVDLVRNDLGRICRYGTVEVPSFLAVERHATVHQLVSTVCGELAPDKDAIDVITACFPPGSMTGAPKIEAMRILEVLEPVERGVYAGGLGYIDFRGTMDLSVVIRTIVVRNGVARVQVGGAIVADSDAESEYAETELKAKALLDALSRTPSGPVRG